MPRKRPGETLTDKQRTFCNEYVIDLNATRAATAAGYSEESARSTASHLLDDDNVQAYVQQLQEDKFLRLRITADEVLKELARIGFAEIEEWTQDARHKTQDGGMAGDGRGSTAADRLTMTHDVDEDRSEEGRKILESLPWRKEGATGDSKDKTPGVKKTYSAAGMIETHSMVNRASMSYKRVVKDAATGTTITYTFSLYHKIMALRIIGQHLGLFIPDKKKEKRELVLIRPRGRGEVTEVMTQDGVK